MSYNVLGVSSGGGVSLFPARKRVIGNIEPRAIFYTPGDQQWKINFPNAFMRRDIPDELFDKQVQVIVSSPDCGSGSVLRLSVNKELGSIKDNLSLSLFFGSIKKYRPEFFYFENLQAMFKSLPEKKFRKKVKRYNLVIHNAPVSMWGNSQIHRKRMVIIGIRKDLVNCNYEKLFQMPDYREKNKTCGELYGNLDLEYSTLDECIESGHVRENIFDSVTMFSKFKCTLAEAKKYWDSNRKQKRWQVEGRNFTNAPGVYRNRKNDYPNTARKANRQFDHNGLTLTPRQLARIQGVSDEFKIHIDIDRLNYWINKGRALVTKTPPMEISKWFFHKLNKYYGTE